MKKVVLLAGLIGLGTSSMFAGTDYAFLTNPLPGSVSYDGESISPYGGALGPDSNVNNASPVELFCDDYTDQTVWGTNWQANLTSVSSGDATLAANTRFGAAASGTTGFNTNFGTATTLYEEVAWLFTQDMAPSADQAGIQEAVWTLTAPQGNSVSSHLTDPNIGYWVNAAQTYYNNATGSVANGYIAPVYSNWAVVTDVNSVGDITGNGNQEFLAYIPPVGYNGPTPTTPEPASFLLFGSGLLGAGLFGRSRRKQRNS